MLLGLLFSFVYLAIEELGDGTFFAQPGVHQQSEYVYLGPPQALTVMEALIGQVFLVTLVARLVTLWVRPSEARAEGA